MPRIKLSELNNYEFHYTVTLEPRDINYGGHLGNDALVSLMGAARVNMLRSIGVSEKDLGDGKTGIIMSDLAVNYKSEAFMFDELVIDTHAGEISRSSFRLFHRINKGQIVVALAETGLTTFNYASRKVAPIPEVFLKALAEHGLQK
ncbi:MAG: thioesterase family protein [Proteobacteria bacterium]|nr:thioesterase family protein [Pseudomonadota bacterium]